MTKPFLSIVTISFNQVQYLRQCIDSILLQKANDVEYIVVDPGSTDGSREVLESYRGSIDHLVFEPDQGPADGLNKGFARATGEIGYFINSDDYILPGAIERMRHLWALNIRADVLLGGAWMIDSQGNPKRELCSTPVTLNALLEGRASIVQQGMSFRLNRFRSVGGFNTFNRSCWDYELLCELLRLHAVVTVTAERFGSFRIYGESISGGVGGSAHAGRYRTDLDGIYLRMKGRLRPSRSTFSMPLRRIAQTWQKPQQSLRYARDVLFPYAMRRRWKKDLHQSSIET